LDRIAKVKNSDDKQNESPKHQMAFIFLTDVTQLFLGMPASCRPAARDGGAPGV
jgi:hypothetical protein